MSVPRVREYPHRAPYFRHCNDLTCGCQSERCRHGCSRCEPSKPPPPYPRYISDQAEASFVKFHNPLSQFGNEWIMPIHGRLPLCRGLEMHRKWLRESSTAFEEDPESRWCVPETQICFGRWVETLSVAQLGSLTVKEALDMYREYAEPLRNERRRLLWGNTGSPGQTPGASPRTEVHGNTSLGTTPTALIESPASRSSTASSSSYHLPPHLREKAQKHIRSCGTRDANGHIPAARLAIIQGMFRDKSLGRWELEDSRAEELIKSGQFKEEEEEWVVRNLLAGDVEDVD